jgi:hypothetical protein
MLSKRRQRGQRHGDEGVTSDLGGGFASMSKDLLVPSFVWPEFARQSSWYQEGNRDNRGADGDGRSPRGAAVDHANQSR